MYTSFYLGIRPEASNSGQAKRHCLSRDRGRSRRALSSPAVSEARTSRALRPEWPKCSTRERRQVLEGAPRTTTPTPAMFCYNKQGWRCHEGGAPSERRRAPHCYLRYARPMPFSVAGEGGGVGGGVGVGGGRDALELVRVALGER